MPVDRHVPFKSRCPQCGYEWLQDGYSRERLVQLLYSDRRIEAYCMACALQWPISAEEQRTLSAQLAETD